jgi:hypothetical protein
MTTDSPGAGSAAPLLPVHDENVRTIDADAPPRPRPILRLFVEYNPFYFLSACCMLLGIFVLNDSLDWSPLPQDNLLILIATLNVYEIALIGLGLLLVRKGLVRDGVFLLTLEALFLADAGFLSMELFTSDVHMGLIVNATLFALGALKLGIVLRTLGMRIAGGLFAFLLAELFILLAIPGLFADVASRRSGNLPPLAIHAGWWALGLVPVLFVVLIRTLASLDAVQLRIARALVALPFVSLVAHLCMANWVYDVTFHPGNLAPLLLGMGVFAGHFDRRVSTLAPRMRLQLALPAVAIVLAGIRLSPEMIWDIPGWPALSPLRLALIAAAMVYLDGWWLHRHPYFLLAASASLVGSGFGPSVSAMGATATHLANQVIELLKRLVPKTSTQWGVVSVAAAFVLLGIGAAFSLLRAVPPRVQGVETS